MPPPRRARRVVRLLAAGTLLGIAATAPAQSQNTPIFPDLEGDALLDALVSTYKPYHVLSYDDARDRLYGEIDNHQDSLTCVYTGYTAYLDPHYSPRSEATRVGLNCEHTWPQSKGASGNAKSDMHHLYATRAVVNSARGSLPFAESPDAGTDRWWRLDYSQGNIPRSHLDAYSEEETNELFEPREDHKGNVARSMFYFYTMYKNQADAADPYFFDRQMETLLLWHSLDAVNDDEVERTWAIANDQSNRPNPFIIDTTLVQRAYFPELAVATPGEAGGRRLILPDPASAVLLRATPNPFNPRITLTYELAIPARVTLTVHDLAGRRVATLQSGKQLAAGTQRISWSPNGLASGIYLCRLRTPEGISGQRRIVLLK
jgi:hypothetical protein